MKTETALDDTGSGMAGGRSDEAGRTMHEFISRLYPLCRSLSGDGVRETLRIIAERIPLEIHEVPTGTEVFDWTVPKEWNIRDAYIRNSRGETIVDFRNSNLHVVGYSIPVNARLTLAELREHLFTIPGKPTWIPYRTSYFRESWGFCMRHDQFEALAEDTYETVIDSSLTEGSMSYGEMLIRGSSTDEVLISTHVCHPAMCNDNLSGIALATEIARHIADRPRRYSYRFLFVPATIGSIAWLALNQGTLPNIQHGLVLACAGDRGRITYKRSRRGDAEIDRAARCALRDSGEEHEIIDFFPYGYDERQYCSPGINLPVGTLMRTPHDRFAEYHTSADDCEFVAPAALADSLEKALATIAIIEGNGRYINLNPMCEPQLGRRGIYKSMADLEEGETTQLALLWVLNLSDGKNTLLDAAEKSGLRFDTIRKAADILIEHNLLREIAAGRA